MFELKFHKNLEEGFSACKHKSKWWFICDFGVPSPQIGHGTIKNKKHEFQKHT